MQLLFRLTKHFTAMVLLVMVSAGAAHASLLWKVSGNGLSEDSYVFGTIHVLCQDRFLMDERIESAFADAERLVVEVDLMAPGAMQRMQGLMLSQEGAYLDEFLSESQLAELDAYFQQNIGAGLQQLGMLKPFALYSMLSVTHLGCAEQASYEIYFGQQAAAQQKPVSELETIEFQLGLFDSIPVAEQIDWIWQMVDDVDGSEAMMEGLMQAYLSEDLASLEEQLSDDPSFSEHADMFLDQRNQNWVQPLVEMMAQESVFIAVGAGHLPGDQGILNLLRAQGYDVEPVPAN